MTSRAPESYSPPQAAAPPRLQRVLRRLTEPTSGVRGPEERVRARALALLTLVIAPAGQLAITLTVLVDATFMPIFMMNTTVVLIILAAGQLARTRHFRLAAGIVLAAILVTCAAAAFLNPGDPGWWAYTSLAVVTAPLLLSIRAAAVVAVVAVVMVAGTLFVMGATGQAFVGPIGWQLVLFPLLLLVANGYDKLSRQREALQRELEDAHRLELVGRMAGGIAHDFNNLLMVISTSTQLARELEGDELEEVLDELDEARARAGSLTQRLLAFSRRQVLRPRDVDLVELTEAFAGVMTTAAKNRLTIEVLDRPLPIHADVSQIEQVLLNLVVNARDATNERGAITLRLARVASGPPGTPLEGRACARFDVIDDGAGIPAELLPQIFEPFFTTKASGGTGLGLATVHAVIVRHGGHLHVQSDRHQGSTFSTHLPLMDAASPEVAPIKAAPEAGSGPFHVLLVDDDDTILRVVARALRNRGHQVVAVSTPEAAFAVVKGEQAFDIVVSDVHMPTMGGPDLLRALRSRQPGLPAVFITGNAFDADYRELEDVPILFKPVAMEELEDTMRQVLARTGA